MPLVHRQIAGHECVCRSGVEFFQSSQSVHVWACASAQGSLHVCVCVIMWSVWVSMSVTVGQPLDRPPAVLKQWNTVPCSFFLCAACTRLGSHEAGPSLAPSVIACTVNGLSGVCQGPPGPIQRQERQRQTDRSKAASCLCGPSKL